RGAHRGLRGDAQAVQRRPAGAPPRMLTLELGLEMEYAALRFWSALADGDLDRLRAARATEVGGALRGNAARVDLPRARTQQQQRGGAASPLAARPARAVASGQQPRSRVG